MPEGFRTVSADEIGPESVRAVPSWAVWHGDCIQGMNMSTPDSIDAIVCDPPYGLGFMGKKWDDLPPGLPWAQACMRVLKPGGHLLAFGGTRTYHRLTCAIEDAGFEIRDCICWMYGSGFPKSLNVSKAIDKAAGPSIETAPATAAAAAWTGWGTALKPAHEPIVLARKPLTGTVAATVLQHGTGALNIDGCRIATDENLNGGTYSSGGNQFGLPGDNRNKRGQGMFAEGAGRLPGQYEPPSGRWPANVVLDPDAGALLDEQTGILPTSPVQPPFIGASRFFYCAKASSKERSAGLENRNGHPTVKPVAFMRYLCRLVTPPGGRVLDPFCGSGSTGIAAVLEGFNFIGLEREADYVEISRARIAHWAENL